MSENITIVLGLDEKVCRICCTLSLHLVNDVQYQSVKCVFRLMKPQSLVVWGRLQFRIRSHCLLQQQLLLVPQASDSRMFPEEVLSKKSFLSFPTRLNVKWQKNFGYFLSLVKSQFKLLIFLVYKRVFCLNYLLNNIVAKLDLGAVILLIVVVIKTHLCS